MSSSSRVTRSEKCLQNCRWCGGDDNIDTFDFRKPDFAASGFYSCTALVKKGCVSALLSKSGHCGIFVKEFENKGSVHWLRQGDKEPGDEYQQAADEGTPGLAFSASGSLGIRRPAGLAPSTYRVSGFRRGFEVSIGPFFERCRMARHRGGLGFIAEMLHDDFWSEFVLRVTRCKLPGAVWCRRVA